MTDLLILPPLAGLIVLLARRAWTARRTEATLRAAVDRLSERLDQVNVRLEAAEQDLAMALSQTGVAEGLLLEKGIADADEVEDMRRRLVTDGTAPGDGDAIH